MNKRNNASPQKRKNLADKSEDSRVKEQQPLQSIEKRNLEEARYQAEQAFQRGGLDREQAYGAYGLDESGNWLKK
jgi:hypothetical protein